ncbi:hypothetical protein MNEG_14045, partial [Monoraphidium neglectum]
ASTCRRTCRPTAGCAAASRRPSTATASSPAATGTASTAPMGLSAPCSSSATRRRRDTQRRAPGRRATC